MKRKFMMLTLLIAGPKQPGNDIDVYLAHLIDDLFEFSGFQQSLLSGVNDLDRATLWLEAKKKKDGEFENDERKEIASKIVGFIEKKKQWLRICGVTTMWMTSTSSM
ncbi:hypothetical protein ACS0TY_022923 [Phlomoides rotata]